MSYCPNCKKEYEDGYLFCLECGSKLESGPSRFGILNPTGKNGNSVPDTEETEEQRKSGSNRSKRKSVLVAAVLIALIGLGIMTALLLNNPSNRIAAAIQKGDYEEVGSIYRRNISNDKVRFTARSLLKQRLDDLIQMFIAGEILYEDASRELRDIDNLDISHMEDAVEEADVRITAAYYEQKAYDAGNDYLQQGKYRQAAESFAQVVNQNAPYFQSAHEKYEQAIQAYRESVISQADKLAENEDYVSIMSLLNEALQFLQEDGTLQEAERFYSTRFEEAVLADAKAAFTTGGYENALDILRQRYAQMRFTSSAIEEAIAYYESYAPVSLADIEPYYQTTWFPSVSREVKDNFGNVYDWAFIVGGAFSDSATYSVKKNYTTLSATVAVPNGNYSADMNGTVTISGDGRILWQKTGIDALTKPESFTVDISGVEDLTIELSGDLYALSSVAVMIADVTIQK